ncbi:MAG: hypothetical protein VST72_06315, partial [Nitrospirota bacterium]|nr:hypothetical protein [Nitrospirota bacterium]
KQRPKPKQKEKQPEKSPWCPIGTCNIKLKDEINALFDGSDKVKFAVGYLYLSSCNAFLYFIKKRLLSRIRSNAFYVLGNLSVKPLAPSLLTV